MIRRYLGGKTIHVVRETDLLAIGSFDDVAFSEDDGQFIVSVKYAVQAEPTKVNPLGLRIDKVRVPYPAISWDQHREAFVARVDG